ncbi:amino acid dehydrogenase [Bradyrhizobium sp. NAS80.1]|uniref:D-amino acid dehydrogenase n=1 Tax=Bradyrhizobium sp. NAS80.1 TaxID=1680159 RepID=UPI00095D0639|nr:D-amino acid dehydrogenase [Bradyrhizobium sp. NAS80.1]OKO88270.1 amino acid dehydrogenase [Bradyrhizobium sp. NAS80.1]
MHALVIGAGIIGMTTAYYLRREGHDVTVVEAGEGVGLETSKANGAQLSYNFVAPLADPAVLPKLPLWLTDKDAPLHFQLRADPAQWRWGLSFLRLCRSGAARQGTIDLLELGLHSRAKLHELMQREAIDCDFASTGKLLVYGDAAGLASAQRQMEFQKTLGSDYLVLDRQGCIDKESSLASQAEKIVGGIFMPDEDSADCFKLCRQLHRRLAGDVRFLFGTRVSRLRRRGRRIVVAETSAGPLEADAYVIANGLGAQQLARQAGFNPHIHALKGYSLTYDLTEVSVAPMCSVSDIATKVVYARLGNRLRVAGMVDVGDNAAEIRSRRVDLLRRQAEALFPQLAPAGEPQVWAGLRPARPSSTPVIGATPCDNLWINAGHGSLGFTLAAGSAALLSDRMAGRPPSIPRHKFIVH